ncbi:PAS domain S-box protein [Desertivirga brevis]|uniref:PAS domain S-box protein n=1 Tax=Desertivirga brevis TaxID=2810310 RepID=UPI001A9571D3|nr:PAS domain-containing protein [Pedobacter sp. SYSU D00873]
MDLARDSGCNHLDNKDIRAIVLISRDISDRKAKDLEIAKNQQKYQSLFDHHPDMVYYQDKDGYILDTNPVNARIYAKYGISKESVVGKHETF